jgi:hypothetical protein
MVRGAAMSTARFNHGAGKPFTSATSVLKLLFLHGSQSGPRQEWSCVEIVRAAAFRIGLDHRRGSAAVSGGLEL